MSLSTHVLDAVRGRPAVGVDVRVERRAGADWIDLAASVTNEDGRIGDLLASADMDAGVYRVTFAAERYFAGSGVEQSFYPEVVIVFRVLDPRAHHHVPILLSPFAYSTYRGS
ncbi:MAG: uraH [Jatrophihabitantaceae bacterium]|nr:uraH [Jatrophihabitantaceae bacterium]